MPVVANEREKQRKARAAAGSWNGTCGN